MLLILPILLPVVVGILVFLQKEEAKRNRLVVLSVLLTAATALACCLLPDQSLTLMTIEGTLTVTLAVDSVSRLFLIVICVIWALVAFFAFPYIKHEGKGQQFFGFYTVTQGTLMGLALAANFVTLYMFFECMTLITSPLVLHDGRFSSRKAALKYMGYSVFGAGVALAGFFFLAGYLTDQRFTPGGMLDPARAAEHGHLLLVVYLLMVVGFGAKAGLLPMQAWLTTAHPVAPAPASAVLSGIITKGGVLAILRVTYYMYGAQFLQNTWAQKTLLILALATIFVGSMLAYKEQVLKKRLAYSTVSQVSYVLFGLLLLTPEGFCGGLLQVVFHAVVKNVLFLAAGAIIYNTHYTEVDQLRGIGQKMPVTMWCFTLGTLSLIGIPPMSGFISKWYLAMGAFHAAFPVVGMVGVVVLLVSALLTAGYLLPIVTRGFFPGADVTVEQKEVGPYMTIPLVILSAFAVLLGLFPNGLIHWLEGLSGLIF